MRIPTGGQVAARGVGGAPPGLPPPGAPHTYLAPGRQRPRQDAVRAVVAPGVRRRVSVEGSSPPWPPVLGDPWRQRAGEGPRAAPRAARTLQVPAEQEEAEQQQQQQQRGGPQRPGAPSGQHGRLRGAQGGARPRAAGSIAGPKDPGGKRRVRRGRRSPDGRPFPSRAVSPPHLLRLGDPVLSLPKARRGAGERGVKAQASPVRAGASPAPNLGSGFTSA